MAARYRMADPRDAGFAVPDSSPDSPEPRRKLNEQEMSLLRVCGRFRSISDHAAAYLDRQPAFPAGRGLRALTRKLLASAGESLDIGECIARLEALANEGFLVSDAALVNRLRELAQGSHLGCRLTTLGLTTRDRVGCLRRGLVSYIENANEYSRPIECLVIDDSASDSVREGNRQMLGGLRRKYGAAMRYAAVPEREEFVEALHAESGIDRDVLRFAVLGDSRCPVTTGSSRNCLLLDTVGACYVLVDDDCVCRLARTPHAQPGLAFASGNDPTEFWFYANRQATLGEVAFEPADFFGVHEEMLGQPLGGLVDRVSNLEALDLDRASPAFYRALCERGGCVRATVGGIIGDSGIGSTAYLFVAAQSAKRLAPSEDAYRQFVESRQVFRVAVRPTVSQGSFCLAGNLGIDNRELLPPFVPVQRNSDGLFARALRLCDPTAYLAHPAWGCLHDPEKPRTQSIEDYWDDMRRLRFGDLLHLLIGACPAMDRAAGPAISLRRLGAYLVDLGKLPPPEFEAVGRAEVARTMDRLADAPPVDSGLPDFYTGLQRKHRAAMRDAAAQPEFVVPRDLDAVADNVTPLAQDLVSRYGEVCEDWPAIVNAASALRARGVRLTREIDPSRTA